MVSSIDPGIGARRWAVVTSQTSFNLLAGRPVLYRSWLYPSKLARPHNAWLDTYWWTTCANTDVPSSNSRKLPRSRVMFMQHRLQEFKMQVSKVQTDVHGSTQIHAYSGLLYEQTRCLVCQWLCTCSQIIILNSTLLHKLVCIFFSA